MYLSQYQNTYSMFLSSVLSSNVRATDIKPLTKINLFLHFLCEK